MISKQDKNVSRVRRHARVRAKISGTTKLKLSTMLKVLP